MNSNDFLIPKAVSDDSIRKHLKMYWPNDYRRNRGYVRNLDRSHPKIQQILPSLNAIVSSHNKKAVEKRAQKTTPRAFSRGCVSYEDLLKKAVAINEPIVTHKKRIVRMRKLQANFYDPKEFTPSKFHVVFRNGSPFVSCRACSRYYLASYNLSKGKMNNMDSDALKSFLSKTINLFFCPTCDTKRLNFYYKAKV